jgi:2-aminoethylphosphonate-pyruvate transaminase
MGIRTSRDDLLLTPGPLTTSQTVKHAMLRDLGSRDSVFLDLTQAIRKRLLKIAQLNDQYTVILMQGSGTFGVESVITTCVPPKGKLLIISNGAYGLRMAEIARISQIPHRLLSYAENEKPCLEEIESYLHQDTQITHVAVVHCETTSGILNPIHEIGALCSQMKKTYIVDAMSSFGGIPISLENSSIDYLISSANKCLESVPGFSFIIARRSLLSITEGWARSLSLDLYSQWKGLETASEFRYTPPVQALLAFEQALNELDEEGGIQVRNTRYQENHQLLVTGMKNLGFQTYLSSEKMGCIITSFLYLKHPKFQYKIFYERLQKQGYVIYSGKVTNAECFRVGNIGRIFRSDIENFLLSVRDVLIKMGVEV